MSHVSQTKQSKRQHKRRIYINRGPLGYKTQHETKKENWRNKKEQEILTKQYDSWLELPARIQKYLGYYFTYLYCSSTLGLLCQTLYKQHNRFCLNDISTLLLLLNLILTSLFLIQYHQLLTLSHHTEVSKSNFTFHLLCNSNFHIFFLPSKPVCFTLSSVCS